jgi:ribosomal protein S18 acetylase RimI-like enzyme
VEITFTSDRTPPRADELVEYLRGPRLWIPRIDYPDFDAWSEKVHAQLKSEEKRALIALSGGAVVGAVVYQRHRSEAGALEIKNLTVRPDMRGRFIARFLLRNAEIEGGSDYGASRVVLDAKASNVALRTYLFGQGYAVREVVDLYGLGTGRDVVYHKRLGRRR